MDTPIDQFLLSDSLTVFDVARVYQTIPSPLPCRVVVLEQVEIDTCGVQLLLAMYRHHAIEQRDFEVTIKNTSLFNKLALFSLPFPVYLDLDEKE